MVAYSMLQDVRPVLHQHPATCNKGYLQVQGIPLVWHETWPAHTDFTAVQQTPPAAHNKKVLHAQGNPLVWHESGLG